MPGNLRTTQKMEIILTAIGVILLIFIISAKFNKPHGNKNISGGLAVSSVNRVDFSAAETGSENAKPWGRDPFYLEQSGGAEGAGPLALNGIMLDRDNPYAIINNEVVKIGDKIGGMTVMEIKEKSVTLDDGGKRQVLELNTM